MEDYIDFPCSPTWLDWYHEQGLTPRHSGRRHFEEKLVKHLDALNRRLEAQEELIRELLRERRRRHKKRKKYYREKKSLEVKAESETSVLEKIAKFMGGGGEGRP